MVGRCGIRAVGFQVTDAGADISYVRVNFMDGGVSVLPVAGRFFEGQSVGPFDVSGWAPSRCISNIVVVGRTVGGSYGNGWNDRFEDEADVDFFGIRY